MTEYGSKPEAFEIKKSGSEAIIFLRENIAQLEANEEEHERWEADEYELRVPWSANIESRITGNFDMWMAKAKTPIVQPVPIEKRIETVEETTESLADIVADILGV